MLKKLVLLVLLSCFVVYSYSQIKQHTKVIALYTTSIILDAVGDGLNDDGNKLLGHTLQSASVGLLIASPFIFDVEKDQWPWYFASYISLRVALFDPAYNLTRGLPIDYIGNSSVSDKFLQMTKPPGGIQIFGRSVFLMVGIAIPLQEIK